MKNEAGGLFQHPANYDKTMGSAGQPKKVLNVEDLHPAPSIENSEESPVHMKRGIKEDAEAFIRRRKKEGYAW